MSPPTPDPLLSRPIDPEPLDRLRETVQAFLDRLQDDEERFAELATRCLHLLDEECTSRLTAGQEEVYGSIVRLQPVFAEFLRHQGTALGLSAAQLADRILRAELFAGFLARLRDEGDLVFFTDRQRARSRAFEVVHYLRHLRQRTRRTERDGLPPARLVEMVKVEVRQRERPVPSRQIRDLLTALDDRADAGLALPAEPDWPAEDEYETLRNAFGRFLDDAFGAGEGFPGFQALAWEELLAAALGRPAAVPARPRAFVIAAGTGFGKTEAFLLPILFYAAAAHVARWRGPTRFRAGTDALLLYPRRDLCDNQAERVLRYAFLLNRRLAAGGAYGSQFPPLRLAVAHSGLYRSFRVRCPACQEERQAAPERWGPEDEQTGFIETVFENGRFREFACQRRPHEAEHQRAAALLVFQLYAQSPQADLLLTTIDTLHRRLMDDHGQERLFRPTLIPPRFVVVDELHIYEGQVGAHAANVLRRCRQRILRMAGVPPVFVGASATAGNPARLAAAAFGVPEAQVVRISPGPDETRPMGLEYFIFLQSPGNRLLTEERAAQTAEGEEAAGAPDVPVRLVTEQATMIQAALCLQHAMKAPAGEGVRKRRTLGFVDSIDVGQRLASNLDNADWQDLWPPRANRLYTLLPLYALRYPLGRPNCQPEASGELPLLASLRDALREAAALSQPQALPGVETSRFQLPVVAADCLRARTGDCRQPPHHLLERCPRYEAGECWFTLGQPGQESLRPAPIQFHRAGGYRSWGNRGRPFDDSQRDRWRLLISTSALEVGFDHPELIATWQFHAPPSTTSFVQRKGRGGRGLRDYPITLLVLGAGDSDRFCFRNHLRLVDVVSDDLAAILDPANPSVRAGHVVAALFDYLAAEHGPDTFYQLRLEELLRLLAGPPADLLRWLDGCFQLPPDERDDILRRLHAQVQVLWHAPLRCAEFDQDGGELRPRDLFLRLDRDRAIRYHDRVERALSQPGLDAGRRQQLERARAWLDQALLYHEERGNSFGRFSAVEFCAHLPDALEPDPDLVIPRTTIPVPLGRHLQIYEADPGQAGGRPLGEEAAEFALRAFLPGGFRIRYRGELWMAPWHSVRPRPTGPHQTWAATRGQLRTAGGPTDTLATRAADTDWAESRRRELLDRLGTDCGLALVSGLEVHSLGTRTQRRFQLDRTRLEIHPRRPEGAHPDDWIELQRDPHLTPRFLVFPHRAGSTQPITLPGTSVLFARARFHPALRLTLAHYANLVHCYPTEEETRTIVVRFWDEQQQRPLCPAVEWRSQGVEFRLAGFRATAWDEAAAARAFWARVESEVLERLLVQHGLLDSAYRIEGLVLLLRWLEADGPHGRVGAWLDATPDPADLARAAERLRGRPAAHADASLLAFVSEQAGAVAETLAAARAWTRTDGPEAVQARTLAAALAQVAGDLLAVAPGTFRHLAEPTVDGWRILLYDNLEGGSGNARQLATALGRLPWSELERRLCAAADCPAAALDRAVAATLRSDHSPDLLAALADSGQLPVEWLPAAPALAGRARGHLRRLLQTPALAAFSQHAFGVLEQLRRRCGGEPPPPLLEDAVERSPALDPRAEALRRRFLEREGGINPLPARLRQLTPLCPAGCPECLGDDPEVAGDRLVLERLVGVG